MRPLLALIAIALLALGTAACGSEGVSVSTDDPTHEGAVLFAERCGGCHTMTPAGTQGSGNRTLRQQGPNLDERAVEYDDALYAIENGGISGAIMPQNIVVGEDAELVSQFIEDYSGTEVDDPPRPSPAEDESLQEQEDSEPDSGETAPYDSEG